jgi:acyl-CoA synthetase (NDP forming)
MADDLRPFFNPRGVAFVGVSPDPMKYAGRALAMLRQGGFSGPIYAVNPKYREVLGTPCVKDTFELPAGIIDLAFIAVSADRVPEVIAKCGRKGIGAAIVASSGFRESGPEGAARETSLVRAARAAGVRVCGPNCIGTANVLDGVVACFSNVFEREVAGGSVGVISQSGSFATIVTDSLRRRGLGVSYVVSSGNEADITAGEYLRFLVVDGRTRVVLIYMEGLRDPQAFLAAAGDALAAGIPVVVLKTGRTRPSQRAILSHTGNLANDHAIEAAVFERHGIVQVSSIEEMVESAMLGARLPAAFARGSGVGVVCIGSGGSTSLAADILEREGLDIPALPEHTAAQLRALLPPFITPQNPLDVAGYSYEDEAELAGLALDAFGADSIFDKLLAFIPGLPHIERCVRAVERVRAASDKPVLTIFGGGSYTEQGLALAKTSSLPWSVDLERAARALKGAIRFAAARATLPLPPRLPPLSPAAGANEILSEHASRQLLLPFGIDAPRERLCHTLAEARAAAASIGYPVALKEQSAAVPHKSDAGGVVLGIADEPALWRAFEKMRDQLCERLNDDAIEGYLVQEMVDGVEVFLGVKNDPTFGLALLIGPGGIFVETMDDIAVCPLPVVAADLERLIAQTALERLFAGLRGRKPAHRPAVITAALALGRYALAERNSIVEVEINPLIVDDRRAVAVDTLIVRRNR